MGLMRKCHVAVITVLLSALLCPDALAQGAPSGAARAYPVKPIRLVVPFPAGASSDVVGRMLGQKISEQLGEQVVPDNRGGAGGNLGIGITAKSPPDGYTMVIATASIAVSPSLYSNLGYDPVRDLAPVARLTSIPNILLVHPSVPAKTLRQFISLARGAPGRLNFGSGGTGTTNHLANELLKSLERINIVHVPYKGATQAMLALIGGEVDEVIVAVAPALPQIRAGKVRPIAVLSERRVAALPDVPTAKEAGVDKFNMSIWYGLFAPAGTPADLIARLNQEATRALESNELRERMTVMGIDPWPGTAEQLGSLVRSETARYAGIVKSAGLRRE